jgi:hypothetical protein
MSSLSPKDRVSLCIFTFDDGRRCRTPRISSHPHFCFYHAQKESRAATADKLAKDLAAFFSGHYVSANDLSTAIARMIPAVVRGDIKPRTARTVAYLAQTLLQAIHHSQSEFKDAFGPEALRKSIRTGITSNHDRLFPPEPQAEPVPERVPEQPAPSVVAPSVGARLQPVPSATPVPSPAAAPAQTAASINTQPPTQPPGPNNPSPTAPPARPPRPPSPHKDPYETRYDADRYHFPEKAF